MSIENDNNKSHTLVSNGEIALSIKALTALAQQVVKILMHLDGTHGVHRQYVGADKVLQCAAENQYILLDLGHVLRLYFGDDYFDLHLDTKIPYVRSVKMAQLVQNVIAENKLNERRKGLVALN
ncbi:MAG: hypothetical protein K6L76_04365 [Agarilytica sp.]